MTDREVMQQALDALELYQSKGSVQMFDDAVKVLRERLAQANEFEPDWDVMAVMVEEQQRMAKRIEELEAQQKPWVKTYVGGKPNYTTPEEPRVKLDASAPLVVQPHPAFQSQPPVQEPVAWLQIGLAPLHDGDVIARTVKPKDWNPDWWRFEPLYTAPPRREWVGLTDEEIKDCEKQAMVNGSLPFEQRSFFARAIEAKIREKNHG